VHNKGLVSDVSVGEFQVVFVRSYLYYGLVAKVQCRAGRQARNKLGKPGWAKSFVRVAQIF